MSLALLGIPLHQANVLLQEAKPYKSDNEVLAMTNLVEAYQKNNIREFEKILRTNKWALHVGKWGSISCRLCDPADPTWVHQFRTGK